MGFTRSGVVVLALVTAAFGQNCLQTSVPGLVPITELGVGTYFGFEGGLYPGGQNTPPAAHANLGLGAAAAIVPRDATGSPSPSGRIVLLSVGMSNTSQESVAFMSVVASDPAVNPLVTVVNGAQGGQTAAIISNPAATFWTVIDQRLAQQGLTANQVQAVWLKEGNANPSGGFPSHATTLQGQLAAIARILAQRYPNCRIAYLSSRSYGGYATTSLNPEPYAYESAFAVKGVIAAQIVGDPTLNADPSAGPVVAPHLAWGPYLWANGVLPRSDGLTWQCSDFEADGTHPGPSGEAKVAALLHAHFVTDPTSAPWFLGSTNPPVPAAVTPYGTGCPGTNGIPNILTNTTPRLGLADFRVGVTNARPASPAVLVLSTQSAQLPLGNGCTAFVDLGAGSLLAPTAALPSTLVTAGNGAGFFSFAIPNDPLLGGVHLFAQWAVADPLGQIPGGASATRALDLRLGN